MDNEIIALYEKYMRDKIFIAHYYKEMERLAKKSLNYNTTLTNTLKEAWRRTDVRQVYCFDSMRIRFITVLATLSALI